MGSMYKAIITGFLCRLCSKMNKCVIHLYGEKAREIHLLRKINKYLPVSIEASDPLPKTVCKDCIEKLESHHSLMRTIDIAHGKLAKRKKSLLKKLHAVTAERRRQQITYRNRRNSSLQEHRSLRDTVRADPPVASTRSGRVRPIALAVRTMRRHQTYSPTSPQERSYSPTSSREGSYSPTSPQEISNESESVSGDNAEQVQIYNREGTPPHHTYDDH